MNVKFIAKQALFKAKNASPAIALGGGIILSVGAVIAACKATPKVDQLLEESRQQIKAIHDIAEQPETIYSENDTQKAIVIVWGKTILGMAKHYAPAIALEAGSIALLLWSHHAMTKRVVALGATVVTLGESLKRMRLQVAEQYGEEKANDIYYGLENKKVEDIVIDTETGEEVKKKVPAKATEPVRMISPYAMLFDSSNPNYMKDDPSGMTDFLSDIELSLNRKLRAQGWMFLNEARMAYGFKPIPEGQVLGWIFDPKDPNQLSDPINCGIDHISRQEVRDFRNGFEKVFIIDFENLKPIIDDFARYDRSYRAA